MPNGKVILVLVVTGILTAGAQTIGKGIGHGVNVAAVKIAKVAKHIVKHPVDSAKTGAGKAAKEN
jgi:hypothetical protein